MQNNTYQFISLESQTLTHVPTNVAAFYLNRKPQTLRAWACLQNGAVNPVRINGRLAWPVAKIMEVLAGGSK